MKKLNYIVGFLGLLIIGCGVFYFFSSTKRDFSDYTKEIVFPSTLEQFRTPSSHPLEEMEVGVQKVIFVKQNKKTTQIYTSESFVNNYCVEIHETIHDKKERETSLKSCNDMVERNSGVFKHFLDRNWDEMKGYHKEASRT